jgi:hypothetical protein
MHVRGTIGSIARGLLVALVVLAASPLAASELESVHISYRAPAPCPDEAAFLRMVQARTTRFRQAAPNEEVRHFSVQVTAMAGLFSGRLQIDTRDGGTSVRDVDANVCEEVADALALMTALAIDPQALVSIPKVVGPAEPKPAESPTPTAATIADGPPRAPREPSPPWQWSAGLAGHMTFALSPNLGYGGDVFVDTEAPPSSVLGPALRLGALYNRSEGKASNGVAATFQWAAATLEGCPVRLRVSVLALHPCVAFRVGLLHGQGRNISDPQQTTSFWADAGPLLRLRLWATASLILEAQGALVFPLNRPSFEIYDQGTRTKVYSVPSLGGSAGVGVSYRFR